MFLYVMKIVQLTHDRYIMTNMTSLLNVVVQGERILKLAEMCRKLETEEEKVLPFYASSLTDQEQTDVDAVVQEPPTQPLAEVRLTAQPVAVLYHLLAAPLKQCYSPWATTLL